MLGVATQLARIPTEEVMMKLILFVVVVAVMTTTLSAGIILVAQDRDGAKDRMEDMLVRNADGSWTPEWEYVGAGSGFPDVVGVSRTSDLHDDTSVYPTPVYSLDDHSVQIGWLGAQGYYPIEGSMPPACQGCPTVVKRVDEDGTTYRLTIRDNGTATEGVTPPPSGNRQSGEGHR